MVDTLKYFPNDWLTKVTPDAIFATITALSVLIISGIVQWIYTRRKNAKYLADLRLLLIEHIRNLINLVEKRLKGYEALSIISPSYKSDFIYKKVSISADSILQLPQVELFQSIRKGHLKNRPARILAFSKLMESLNFISSESLIVESQFSYFTSHHSEFSRLFNDSTNELISFYREYLSDNVKNKIKPSDDSFLSNLNKIFTNWAQLPDKDDIDNIYTSLLLPVRQVCVDHQGDTRRLRLLTSINKADNAKANRDRILILMGKYFQEEIVLLQSRNEILKYSLTILSS